MGPSYVFFDGRNDAVLCDCGQELRVLTTYELGAELRVVDMLAYFSEECTVSVKHEPTGVVVTTTTTARPHSLRRRVIHATAFCGACHKHAWFEIGFNGNQVVKLEPLR